MKRTQILAALAAVTATVFLLAPAASAQTGGYPPGDCSVLTGTVDVGTVNVGQTFVVQLAPQCVFTPGAAVTVTVNGVNIPGKVATSSGTVLVEVTVVSATQLSIDDPVLTPAFCGPNAVNTVTATGPSAAAGGRQVTQTATFRINCPGTTTGGTTGATTGTTTGPARPITGRLALTGSNLLRFLAIALALVAMGSAIVITARRRRSSGA
jgi:hypothetical protein